MKKVLYIMVCAAFLSACNHSSESNRRIAIKDVEEEQLVEAPAFVEESAAEAPAEATAAEEIAEPTAEVTGEVTVLTESGFCREVFDFRNSDGEWKFRGDRPCVVDCYAPWCGPCRYIAPFFDTLAEEYAGQVRFYKIDVDNAPNLSSFFGIESIPRVMFCTKGQLYVETGANDISFYRAAIDSLLLGR